MTIDELRTLRGLSMTKLCDAAGLSMGAIFRLTRPGADITGARLETLMKLAAGLDAGDDDGIERGAGGVDGGGPAGGAGTDDGDANGTSLGHDAYLGSDSRLRDASLA